MDAFGPRSRSWNRGPQTSNALVSADVACLKSELQSKPQRGQHEIPDTQRHDRHYLVFCAGRPGSIGRARDEKQPTSQVLGDEPVGIAETSHIDPLGETWSCAAFFPNSTGHTCLGFVWQHGVMNALPTLGGNNGYAAAANNVGQVVGWAETPVHDATCIAPQVLQFQAVIWGPRRDQIQQLPPLEGDPDSAATAINDRGQVVGISGTCYKAVGALSAKHAVLWEDGKATDIGNLGGIAWNTPAAINNRGDVAGFSDLPGDDPDHPNFHAFFWTKRDGIQDLGTLPGDRISLAFGVNDRGQVVGESIGPNGRRAFLWQRGIMTDLNTLVPQGSPLLVYANDINDAGEIVGQANDQSTGDSLAFVALPRRGGEDN